jgi:predicted lipid-binding transport protein (Tim44 family)
MHKLSGLLLTMIVAVTLSFGGISNAEAKRFGGASSFGSKSSYSKSYNRKSSAPKQRSASQQKAHEQNQAARQSMSKRGGLMGILGGLALGGLLGSLLFGGAFENFNFMDILIFGGITFVLFKLFAARASRQHVPSASYGSTGHSNQTAEPLSSSYQRVENPSKNNAGFDTDIFANKGQTADFEEKVIEDAIVLPQDFNEQDFLHGAQGAFKMLQAAWDKKDLAEIRSLTTDKVFAEIQDQLKASTESNHTDILKIETELLEVRELDNYLEAVVLFDTLMREETNGSPEQVREVWTFIKQTNSLHPKWLLDGLQQLES